jgi:hypothetical protein
VQWKINLVNLSTRINRLSWRPHRPIRQLSDPVQSFHQWVEVVVIIVVVVVVKEMPIEP